MRRLQVNAFGFGGSNYVVQLEQSMDEAATVLVSPEGETPEHLGVTFFRTRMNGHHCRMAVVAESDEAALTVIERSRHLLTDDGIMTPMTSRSLAQQGIFMGPENPPVLPLALVFPGQGTHYAGMGQDLYESFSVIKSWMDRAAAAADFDLLHLLFHDREENLQKTRWQQPALFVLEYAMARYLLSLGIRPVAMAGHSLGELTALCLAGVYSLEDGFRIVNKRALCMDKAAAMHVDPGVMAATDAPLELLNDLIQGREINVHISNINSPRQVVLSGKTGEVKNFCHRLKEMGYRATLLRVSMAFHSPIMSVIHDDLESFIANIPFHSPQIPVISNTTMAPYPSEPAEIRRILMAHLESPVHWMHNVQTLWNDYGVRLFMEVGPGDVLSDLIAETLSDAICIQTCLPREESLTCKTALARLFMQGHLKVHKEINTTFTEDAPTSGIRSMTGGPFPPENRREPPEAMETPAPGDAPENPDHIERLIRIIMDATGFERSEIQPEMDLRKDLSIRSSRLPIIMDAAERHFGITIELQDFIHVRTVKDIALKITEIIARQEDAGLRPATRDVDPGATRNEILKPSADEESLKRLVFSYVPVVSPASIPMKLAAGESVLLLSPDSEDRIASSARDIFRLDYGIGIFPLPFMQGNFGPGKTGFDIRTAEGAHGAADRIAGLTSPAGMVISLHQMPERLRSMAEVSRLLRGLFILLKTFLKVPDIKFVVLIHSREDTETPVRLLAEGMTGLFLSAAQEYPTVQFRSLEIDHHTDIRAALSDALDRGYTTVEMAHRDGRVFTAEGHIAPSRFRNLPSFDLIPGDVVVMSGGATGISAYLARSLAPFKPRLVFLGRTALDHGMSIATPRPKQPPSASFGFKDRALEIARTLADLHASGIEASYHTCDVTDPDAVLAVMGEVANRYGKIRGIIHGAGVLRDGFLGQMTPDDFSRVIDIKFLGAWNLFHAVEKDGLRFFVVLSSAAAIQGNPGQTNYAAANRMMSALITGLRRKNTAIRFKALMLPPIEGAGMAEDPDVREMMRRKGASYIHVNELAGLFCRELFASQDDEDRVLFMRTLPCVKTARLNVMVRPLPEGELNGGFAAFSPEDLPMIEGISSLDIRRDQLEAFRSFSRKKDLWIEDHRPLTFIKHPLVSAAMFLETFMEAARILFPHLQVRGIRQVRFQDMIQCPSGVPRSSRISCRRVDGRLSEVLCEVSLAAQEISPTGRLTDRFTPHCKCQVILVSGEGCLGEGFLDFPVRTDELTTGPMNQKNMLKWYKKHSGLKGRYRVLECLDGAGPKVMRGLTLYRQTDDFKNLRRAQYQYAPYLLEALLQLAGLHGIAMKMPEKRSMIPLEIGEMRFSRKCRVGEPITLEARMREQNTQSQSWDARGLDDQGRTIMQISNMVMRWVSG